MMTYHQFLTDPSLLLHQYPFICGTMKATVLLFCVMGFIASAAAEKYHKRVGIPMARKIRLQESRRLAGGISSYPGDHTFFAGLIITLRSGETSVCGGALISHDLVLTIGQCWLDGESEGRKMLVVLGTNKLFYGGIRNYANWTVVHPQYDPDSLENDLALARIPSFRQYNNISDYIKPIRIPEYWRSDLYEGYLAQLIGFGKTGPDAAIDITSSLRYVYVKIMGHAACKFFYGSAVKDANEFICTSGNKKRGACEGDYGGPLILRGFNSGQDMVAKYSYGTAERRMLHMVLCWASTVHKMHGSTIEHDVLYLGPKLFAAGQAYVALSRIKSLGGLLIEELDSPKLNRKQTVQ